MESGPLANALYNRTEVVKQARTHKAFTLVELLTVVAILGLLAAILFPIFRAAKASALKTTCLSNFRQVQTATAMYLTDYDDRFMPVNYSIVDVGNANRDKTWVQLLLPYAGSFGLNRCPADHGTRPKTDASFDLDLVVEDADRRFYQASLRSNVGYNYLYFSPVYREGTVWTVRTKSQSEISESTKTILYTDSVYRRTAAGSPVGGGSYIVVPPCRYMDTPAGLYDTFNLPPTAFVYAPNPGWLVSNSLSSFRYGLAWPWHDGKVNVGYMGMGTKSLPISTLSLGCDVRDNWTGRIKDTNNYSWDSN